CRDSLSPTPSSNSLHAAVPLSACVTSSCPGDAAESRLAPAPSATPTAPSAPVRSRSRRVKIESLMTGSFVGRGGGAQDDPGQLPDRKSTRLKSSHVKSWYAVFW